MMNPDNTVEYNSLSWVRAQLDDVLSDAQSSLNEYIENKTDEHLENCIEHLQLIYGTLQMVEVYGAAMLAEEMQQTSSALLQGNVEREEDAYDVLMRAMLQLPDYLENIQAGNKDTPITLMPLINDLRAARKEGLLTESVLFSPDIENVELAAAGYDADNIKPGTLQAEVKRLRTHYQLGLLDYIRNNKERVGLQRIKAVLHSLEKVSSNAEVRRMWAVIGALVEGLMKQGIDSNLSVKMLLGAVDRQLKLILDVGEEDFARQYSKELIKNVLYYVGLCTVESKAINAVKEAYKLSDLITQETEESASNIGGLNAELFNTVSKGITEDIEQVKEVLELFMLGSEKDLKQLVPVADQLGKIADTYGMLSMGATRQSIMEQRAVVDSIINGDTEINEQIVSGVAFELLNAESELKDYIASRSGFVDMNRDAGEQAVPAAEYRDVVFTVVSEALKNFSDAKEAILSYVSGVADREKLEYILNNLEEVRGVSMMLPLGRVEAQIDKLQNYIRVALLNNDHQADESEQDTVADVVTSIEYFFEALSEGRPGVEQGLNAGDEAASKLEAVTQSYGDSVQAGAVEEMAAVAEEPVSEPADTIAADNTLETSNEEEASKEQVKLEAVVPEASIAPENIEQYSILAEDADEEIVEIFIEEAVEVLEELHTYLPQWKVNNSDEEALAVVRRSFHTLKGSGRLLGADLIGEFAWKFENMLNRIIDNKINVSETLLHALDEAVAVLPQLIEQLKGNREPIENISQLMASAEALTEGREVVFEATDKVEPAGTEVAEPVKDESEAIAIDDAEVINIDADTFDEGEDINLEIDDFETQDETVIVVDSEQSDEVAMQLSDDQIEIDDLAITDDAETAELDVTDLELEADSLLDVEEVAEDVVASGISEGITEDAELIDLSEDIDLSVEEISLDREELNVLADVADSSDEYVVETDEAKHIVSVSDEILDIDPMLLKIYHDESKSHLATIKQLLDGSSSENQPLKADKNLMRAFHTLNGSARTADVMAIADLCGPTEKYIKARQESEEDNIPDDVTAVVREIEQVIGQMLVLVSDGKLPANNKKLQEKINKIVQQEIQTQLQRSWQDKSIPVDEGDSADVAVDLAGVDIEVSETSEQAPEIPAETEKEATKETVAEEPVQMEYGDIDEELIDIFLEEAEELLENCEDTLNEIKAAPESTEHIHQLQRNMHTLKGGARMAELTPIGDLTHNLESLVVMVDEKKIDADKILFYLLQESLDVLTTLLTNVKQRQPLLDVSNLNNRIEMLMRGEVEEKRAVERFDIEVSQLEPTDDEEELEDIDISALLPGADSRDDVVEEVAVEEAASEDVVEEVTSETTVEELATEHRAEQEIADKSETKQAEPVKPQRRKEDKKTEKPHWGERATDVNFKDSQEQIRVRSDLLNNLVNYAGEVNIYHARMGKQISDFSFNLSELTATVVRLKEQLRNLEIETEIQIRSGYEKEADNFDEDFDPLEMDKYSTLQQLTRSLSETAGDVDSINDILSEITRDSETLLVQESRISTDLQEGLMRTRMVRFGGLSSRLRRIVRQISRELGKEVEVEISGESSEVDRTVLDRIIAPLEHMLRNAVAHGIESPEARKVLGKDEIGKILIDVDRQGASVVVNVKDDGAGINVDKIRAKAIKQGFIKEDSDLSDHDTLQFILQSGFSTAEEVTQVAGRGVGMDVVDSEIKQLGGVLDISTVQGKGTEFNIRLPLTLAINQALLVSAADDVFAVPLASIEGVVRITGLELQRFYDSDHSHYEFNGVDYELKHLGGLLTGNQPNYAKELQLFPVLLVHVGDKHFALHVEDLIGRREIVVKPVGMQISSVHGIAGATILADGRVVLILEMSALVVAESLFKPHAPVEEAAPAVVEHKKTIMVVDDSITIRKITERMLKRYGLDVILAKDGVDATNQLQERIPDLMLLDIEMPRMDGFEVASYVRNDDKLKNIPIIMITSRTGSKHKEKAMEIGVNQYLGKPFQEDDLVKNINEILDTSF